MPLSKSKIKEYISSGGNICPYCGGQNVEGGERNSDDSITTQYVSCHDCGKSWTDIYKLIDIQED